MAQLTVRIPDGGAGVRQGARLAPGGGQVTPGAGLLPGPAQVARQDPAAAAAPFEAIRQGAKEVDRLAETVLAARIDEQSNLARAKALQALAEAEVGARGDIEAFRTQSREAFGRIAEEIEDPAARRRFLSRIEPEAASIEFRVRSRGAQAQGARAAAAAETVLAAEETRAAAAATPAERDAAIASGVRVINDALAAGYITGPVARNRLARFQATVSEGTARRLLVENPAGAAAALRDPAQLPGLSPVTRYRLLDQAVRRGRVGAGGLRIGGGPDPEDVPELPPEARQGLDREAERGAALEDEAELRTVATAERAGLAAATTLARSASVSWFSAVAGRDGGDPAAPALGEVADLLPAEVALAAREVSANGGAGRDEPGALDLLLTMAGDEEPAAFEREAAREVAAGRLTPGGFLRLTAANREAAAETPEARAWRTVRTQAAEIVSPPDFSDVAPGVDFVGSRRDALEELDAWRAANPRASAGQARDEARAIATRHRQALADRVMAALPRPEEVGGMDGPYAPEALDEAEAAVLAGVDEGTMDQGEAARRLRLLEAWRWLGEDTETADDEAGRDGARFRGMRFR